MKYSLFQWAIHVRFKNIVVEGFVVGDGQAPQLYKTGAVLEAITNSVIRTLSGNIYVLKGPLCWDATLQAGMPKWFASKFLNGFPKNWPKILEDYVKFPNDGNSFNETADHYATANCDNSASLVSREVDSERKPAIPHLDWSSFSFDDNADSSDASIVVHVPGTVKSTWGMRKTAPDRGSNVVDAALSPLFLNGLDDTVVKEEHDVEAELSTTLVEDDLQLGSGNGVDPRDTPVSRGKVCSVDSRKSAGKPGSRNSSGKKKSMQKEIEVFDAFYRTRSGRHVFPPLQYWTRQRLTRRLDKDGNDVVVLCPGEKSTLVPDLRSPAAEIIRTTGWVQRKLQSDKIECEPDRSVAGKAVPKARQKSVSKRKGKQDQKHKKPNGRRKCIESRKSVSEANDEVLRSMKPCKVILSRCIAATETAKIFQDSVRNKAECNVSKINSVIDSAAGNFFLSKEAAALAKSPRLPRPRACGNASGPKKTSIRREKTHSSKGKRVKPSPASSPAISAPAKNFALSSSFSASGGEAADKKSPVKRKARKTGKEPSPKQRKVISKEAADKKQASVKEENQALCVTARRGTLRERKQVKQVLQMINCPKNEQDFYTSENHNLPLLHAKVGSEFSYNVDAFSDVPFTPNTKWCDDINQMASTPAWFRTPGQVNDPNLSVGSVKTPAHLKSYFPDQVVCGQATEAADKAVVQLRRDRKRKEKCSLPRNTNKRAQKPRQQKLTIPAGLFAVTAEEDDRSSEDDYFSDD